MQSQRNRLRTRMLIKGLEAALRKAIAERVQQGARSGLPCQAAHEAVVYTLLEFVALEMATLLRVRQSPPGTSSFVVPMSHARALHEALMMTASQLLDAEETTADWAGQKAGRA